jgi:hypothetical protein
MGASGSVRLLGSAAILLAVMSGLASCLLAQEPLAVPMPQTDGSQAIDPQFDDGQLTGDPNYRRPRYAEPQLPPVDYWQPTWMPCQSLRTNRSLVLGHLYWGADILGWATKGVHVPPLVTSGSLNSGDGVIGQGDTAIRFGNDFQLNSMTPGGRLTIGWWFDPNQYSGIEWHYFELDNRNTFTGAVADGSSILARPFLNGGAEDAALTASDTRLNASVLAETDFQLTSTGIVFRDLLWSSPFARLDYLAGYRHTHFFDRVRVDEKFTASGDSEFGDDHVTRVDQFRTINQFDGLDLGFKGWWSNNGKLAVTSVSRFAIGATTNSALINGYTVTGTGRNAVTTNGGVLATPTTAVLRRGQTQFGTVTELGLGLSWQPGCFWKFNLGYTWFYWSEVARAASQIDRSGTTGANFQLHTTSFWADGINGGFTHQF